MGVPGYGLTPLGNVTLPGKDSFRGKVLSGSKVVAFLDNVMILSRLVPSIFVVDSSSGDITFKMPVDVRYDEEKNTLEAVHTIIKTTGEIKEAVFTLPKTENTTVTLHNITDRKLTLFSVDTQCSSGIAWSDDYRDAGMCLAEYAKHGAGLIIRQPEDPGGLTYVSEADSVVVSTTGSLLLASTSPQYDLNKLPTAWTRELSCCTGMALGRSLSKQKRAPPEKAKHMKRHQHGTLTLTGKRS